MTTKNKIIELVDKSILLNKDQKEGVLKAIEIISGSELEELLKLLLMEEDNLNKTIEKIIIKNPNFIADFENFKKKTMKEMYSKAEKISEKEDNFNLDEQLNQI